jgi:tRNA(Ile)-lysidine synthase
MLRKESASEAEAVHKIAEEMNLPYMSAQEDVEVFAEANGLSLEEAARVSRYRFLFRQAEFHQAQAVAVGHTADDQVETMLMHLLRGAGLSGLKGIVYRSLPNSWSQSIPLVRPLLNVWREEISAYLVEHSLRPNLDGSNLDVRFYRNLLRCEVIPYLESIQPTLRKNLWRTAEILGEDHVVMENLVDAAWRKCVVDEGPDYLAFSPDNLREQPPGLQRYLFRRGIDRLRPGLRDVDFDVTERAVHFLNKPPHSGIVDLTAGLYLRYEKLVGFYITHNLINHGDTESTESIENNNLLDIERIWMATREANLPNTGWPQMSFTGKYKLDVPGEVILENGWRMVADMMYDSETALTEAFANPDPFQAWLDLDSLQLPLLIRARLPGDRFCPLGMGGRSVKVSDLMVNAKLPRRARERWPLLLSGEEIAWVPGLRIGQKFQIIEKTRRILKIRVIRYL